MTTYILLLRGINVGGKNKIPMADLRLFLEEEGFKQVKTYIQSGNVIVRSKLDAEEVEREIESILPEKFKLDSSLIKVLALTYDQLKAVVEDKPEGFGEEPDKYHSDAIFMIDLPVDEAIKVFTPKEGVDKVWPGKGVIYSQRLSSQLTKSRLGKIIGTTAYKSMTIRSWNTTVKLLDLASKMDEE